MYGGIDLAAKVENDTGVCRLVEDGRYELHTVFEDEEIIDLVKNSSVIAVDAPLTETEKPFREAERELMNKFGPMLPLNTPGMKELRERAVRLKENLERISKAVLIETYPRAVEKVLNLNRKVVKIDFDNVHEYDAYLCALTAKKYDQGEYERYGEKTESIVL